MLIRNLILQETVSPRETKLMQKFMQKNSERDLILI